MVVYKLSEFAKLTHVSTATVRRWRKRKIICGRKLDGYHYFYNNRDYKLFLHLKKTDPDLLFRKKNFKYRDLTNMRFGKLVVVSRAHDYIGTNGHRQLQWLCRCDCGNTVIAKGTSLTSGYKKSCGCLLHGTSDTIRMCKELRQLECHNYSKLLDRYNVPNDSIDQVLSFKSGMLRKSKPSGVLDDLSGRVFGFWTVLYRGQTRYYKHGGQAVCWVCRCVCGNIKTVPGRDLKSGASKSCGCMTKMSWLEYYTQQYLKQRGFAYVYQKTFSDLRGLGGRCLSYDFYIKLPFKCLIECQGEQHFRPVRKFGGVRKLLIQHVHDSFKYKYASEHLGIPLIYVSYLLTTKQDIFRYFDATFDKLSRNNNLL